MEINYEAIDRHLNSLLLREVPEYDIVAVRNKNRKWAMSSALQKSIRRCRVSTGLTMTHGLRSVDSNYLRWRGRILAIEDIGCANPELVASVWRWASRKDSSAASLDGHLKIALAMLESKTDRTQCELIVAPADDPAYQEDFNEVKSILASELHKRDEHIFNAVKNGRLGLASMLLKTLIVKQGWMAANQWKNKTKHVNIPMLIEVQEELISRLNRPESEINAIRYCVQSAPSGAVMLPLGMLVLGDSVDNPPEDRVYIDLPYIGHYPSETWDKHTVEGKKAMAYLYKLEPRIEKLAIECNKLAAGNQQATYGVMHEVLFRVDSACLKNAISGPIARNIELEGSYACPAAYGATRNEIEDAWQLMIECKDKLHYARCKVLGAKASKSWEEENG